MPELAEVEFFRKRWHQSAVGQRVVAAHVNEAAKVFRGTRATQIPSALIRAKLLSSETAAKQMLFRFSGDAWLGIHLGMTGELEVKPSDHVRRKHDHLVLVFKQQQLVFSDPRMFGRIQFHKGKNAPDWWTKIAPPILSAHFTEAAVAQFLGRRRKAPIKAVLLMQERFPGIGNWMADEILWRAGIHPKRLAGALEPAEIKTLWTECRTVCRQALDKIAGRGDSLPADLNVNIPESWLFRHRWRAGGKCPVTGAKLMRAEIGGRTTCWSPVKQPQVGQENAARRTSRKGATEVTADSPKHSRRRRRP